MLYWLNAAGGDLMAMPADGSASPKRLVDNLADPFELFFDGSDQALYWANFEGTTINRLPICGCL